MTMRQLDNEGAGSSTHGVPLFHSHLMLLLPRQSAGPTQAVQGGVGETDPDLARGAQEHAEVSAR